MEHGTHIQACSDDTKPPLVNSKQTDLTCLQVDGEEEEKVSKAQTPYSCDKCDFVTIHKNGLLSHLGNVHAPKAKPFKCKLCNYATAKNRNLWKHMRRIHGQVAKPKKPRCEQCNSAPCKCKVTYSCDQCPYTAKQKIHLAGHVARVHEGVKNFMCEECGTSFWRNSNLKKHVRDKHGQKNFTCDKCSYKTSQQRSLKYHMQYVHEGLKPYRCSYSECDYPGASTKAKLDDHLRTCHNHIYKCDDCNYETLARLDLVKHRKSTHLKCHECALTFNKKTHLTAHMIDLHPDVKPYACDICMYATADQLLLKRHIRLTHADTKKLLSCPHCSFVTIRQDSLTKHMKYIHEHKEKPYKCSYPNCSAGTYTQAKLDTHMRRKHIEGRHHYKDERTLEWKQKLEEENNERKNLESGAKMSDAGTTLIETGSSISGDVFSKDDCPNPTETEDKLEYFDDQQNGIVLTRQQSAADGFVSDDDTEEDLLKESTLLITEDDIHTSLGQQSDKEWIESAGPCNTEELLITAAEPGSDLLYKCSLCNYSSTKLCYLTTHMRRIHGDISIKQHGKLESDDAPISADDPECSKSYPCDKCNYSTDQKYLLDRHLSNVHSNLKTFVCDMCAFKTTYKYGQKSYVYVQ